MAEDKKIRISADLSQLRELREEATGLYRDINSLSKSTGASEESIAKLKEQLALLGERNDLEALYNELRKRGAETSQPSTENTKRQEREPLREEAQKESHTPREIAPSAEIPSPFNQLSTEELIERIKKRRAESESQDLPGFVETSKDFISESNPRGRKTINDLESATTFEERDLAQQAYAEEQKRIRDFEQERERIKEEQQRDNEEQDKTLNRPPADSVTEPTLPNEESSKPNNNSGSRDLLPPPPVPSELGDSQTSGDNPPMRDFPPPTEQDFEQLVDQSSESSRGVDLLAFLEGWKSQLSSENGRQYYLSTDIKELASEIKQFLETGKNDDDNEPTPPSNPPPATPGKNGKGNGITGGRNGSLPSARSLAGQIAGGGLMLQMMNYAFGKLQEGIQIITNRHLRTLSIGEQKDYMNPISSVQSYTSYKGKQAADPYRIIPIFGGIAAGEIETIAEAKAQKQGIGLNAAAQLESQVRPYAQTFGVSNGRAESIAFREGGYAAGSLGMDVGQYSEKRAQLVRAGGGVEKVSGVRESQSLMAAERLYGLNPSATASLQGSMRFSEKGSETTNSSSSVIRIFEQTMRDLKKPFSEIASTIDESLSTFNRSAESILAKTGDFDAAKVAGVLAGIRAYTGAEGKQLERYQESFSGQTISQDEVTQALLLRTVTKMDSSVKTYSDAMAKIEKIQEDPAAMKDFVKGLQGLTQTNEQFINVLKAVFPKLSYSDIKEQVGKPGFSIDALFDKIMASTKKMQQANDKKMQYERDAAAKTVGTIESANASYQNQMKGYGASIAGDISKIRAELEKIKGTTDVKNGLDEAAEVIGVAFEKFGGKIMEASKKAGPAQNWIGLQGAQLFAIGRALEQMFKEKN